MIGRVLMIAILLAPLPARAQDVPGIEICTVDKTMERRTSCLQSNVEFLVKTINRLRSDNDQRLDAANRQIASMRATLTELQKSVAELQAKAAPPSPPPAKGAAAATETPAAKDAPAAKPDTK